MHHDQLDILSEIMNRQNYIPRHARPADRRITRRLLAYLIRIGMAGLMIAAAVATLTLAGCGPADPQLRTAEIGKAFYIVHYVGYGKHDDSIPTCFEYTPNQGAPEVKCPKHVPKDRTVVYETQKRLTDGTDIRSCVIKYATAIKAMPVACLTDGQFQGR